MADTDLSEKQLEILHDHYKETFGRVREYERSRDRLFLLVILLFALLALEIGWSSAFTDGAVKFSLLGAEIDVQKLPLPALLNATWVLTLAMTMRYCQAATWIERHYPYVHMLEKKISPALGGGDIYQREGEVYKVGYPPILNLTWYAYVIIFPGILVVSIAALLYWEWTHLEYRCFHLIFDSVIAAALTVFVLVYWVEPSLLRKWPKSFGWWRKWRKQRVEKGKKQAAEQQAVEEEPASD